MCIFSREVDSVTGTSIFARRSGSGRQFLVYSMTMAAKTDVAMILPLPVPPRSGELDVRFISLKQYPDFFKEMRTGFRMPRERPVSRQLPKGGSFGGGKLAVVAVGEFEASFVPTIKDFTRLDERFRLSQVIWDRLPQYQDFGFAVFKLKAGERSIHPMAFDFPRKTPERLSFPTVHVHDGEVHPKATFDHLLYCQPSDQESLAVMDWEESKRLAQHFMRPASTRGIVAPNQHCYFRRMTGMHKNEDVTVAIA